MTCRQSFSAMHAPRLLVSSKPGLPLSSDLCPPVRLQVRIVRMIRWFCSYTVLLRVSDCLRAPYRCADEAAAPPTGEVAKDGANPFPYYRHHVPNP